MKVYTYESFSERETFNYGRAIARYAKPDKIFTLSGELGAGKTAFSKGFAFGMGVEEEVTSPTFAILNIYESGRVPLYHFDLYRIDLDGFIDMGFEDYFYDKKGASLIEWSENIEEILPEPRIDIKISRNLKQGENYRIIEVVMR